MDELKKDMLPGQGRAERLGRFFIFPHKLIYGHRQKRNV